jgi:hypothetical protein
VKFADKFVLLANAEMALQDMTDKLIEIGKCYGIEMNMEKTKLMKISRQPFPVKLMIEQKQMDNVYFFFKYLTIIKFTPSVGKYSFTKPFDQNSQNYKGNYNKPRVFAVVLWPSGR